MFYLLGYPAALLIGVSLGLIGAGGAILTIPVLVYLFNVPANLATTYSLFVVGLTALTGSIGYIRNKLLCLQTAVTFGLASIISVFITRKFIFPNIPSQFDFWGLSFTKDKFLLVTFALVTICAAISMIRQPKVILKERFQFVKRYGMFFRATNGLAVGFLSGLLGAGGGFLIIPTLVLVEELPMKMAIGTSLVIIAVNSFIGFAGDVYTDITIDWTLLLSLSALALSGIFIGMLLSKKITGTKLKPAFGWFILILGCYIIIKSYLT